MWLCHIHTYTNTDMCFTRMTDFPWQILTHAKPDWVNVCGCGDKELSQERFIDSWLLLLLIFFLFQKDFVWYVLRSLCYNGTCSDHTPISIAHTRTWHVSRLHTLTYVEFNCAITINHVPWRLYFPTDVHSYFIAEACSLWSFYVYFMQFLTYICLCILDSAHNTIHNSLLERNISA